MTAGSTILLFSISSMVFVNKCMIIKIVQNKINKKTFECHWAHWEILK